MNLKITSYLLCFITIVMISCGKKNDAKPDEQKPDPTTNTRVLRIQQGIGVEDTIFLITYDANNRIKSIVDSTEKSDLQATYNEAGLLTSTIQKYTDGSASTPVTFTYNADNTLAEANTTFGTLEKFRNVFEYTNGVISKRTFYDYDLSKSTLRYWKYWTYVVTNGNITNRKEFDSDNKLVEEISYTYTNDANFFKPFALVNFQNKVGLNYLCEEEIIFNKNSIASYTRQGFTTTFTYSYNSNKLPVKVIEISKYYTNTRAFSY